MGGIADKAPLFFGEITSILPIFFPDEWPLMHTSGLIISSFSDPDKFEFCVDIDVSSDRRCHLYWEAHQIMSDHSTTPFSSQSY